MPYCIDRLTCDEFDAALCGTIGTTKVCLNTGMKSPQAACASDSAGAALLAGLLDRWQKRAKHYEDTLQVGRYGSDDRSYDHGAMDRLDECIEELINELDS